MGRRIFTIEERKEIGKEIFTRLLETKYDISVREEIQRKYDISLSSVNKLFNEYKNGILAPKPSYQELTLLEHYMYERFLERNNNLKTYKSVEQILKSDDEQLKELLNKFGMSYLVNKINLYIKSKPTETHNIELLNQIKEKLSKFDYMRKEQRLATKTAMKEDEIDRLSRAFVEGEVIDNKYFVGFLNVINGYLNSNDVYPHYKIREFEVNGKTFGEYLKRCSKAKDPYILNLVANYKATIKQREQDFVDLVCELVDMINESNINILDFYKKTHMTISKFKTFMTIALVRHIINASVINIINNFFDKYQYGSLTLSNIEDALSISYEYNGIKMTENDIREICTSLQEQNIPINRYSIILTFDEKVRGNLNKK